MKKQVSNGVGGYSREKYTADKPLVGILVSADDFDVAIDDMSMSYSLGKTLGDFT